ncbi:MAG TPA: phospho-sugar mutase [Acidimicrobiia bacterium]|nr:phospho-sugar mutase [Acidimicrobiia bacterium]
MIDPALAAAVRAWIDADPDPHTRAELEALLAADDASALADRFAGPLEFGTAGLRGALGGGPSRMNVAVVRAAARGLATFLLEARSGAAERGVVIGYDARHQSREFAHDSAAVLAAAGLRVHLADRCWPTPVTAFAVRHLGAAAGVMVTASHNPAPDNGYKVYEGNGAQITAPVDTEIASHIASAGPATEIPLAHDSSRIGAIGDDVIGAYLDEALATVPYAGPRAVRIAYTPLHGVGRDVLLPLFARAGFDAPVVVAEQSEPDPDFPTTVFPNPEEPGALDLAFATAQRTGADIVLANDPDADRLAVAVPTTDGYRRLTGDELGALLAEWLLRRGSGTDRLAVTTIVSSTLLDRIAAAHGASSARVLTGFKWIARAVEDRPTLRFVCGYEEALGYAIGPHARDKDGLTAALAVAAMTAELLAAGRTLTDALDDLARVHGVHATSQWSVRFEGAAGAAEMSALMQRVRSAPPASLGGVEVAAVTDFLAPTTGLPAADVVQLDLADSSRVLIRPSGTEPKLKCYFEVVEPVGADVASARAAAERRLATLRADVGAATGLR